MAVLRYLDLLLLALALPAFIVAGWPLGGYAATAGAWLVQRGIHAYATRRAIDSGNKQTAMRVVAGTMVGRIWLIALAVFAAGLADREAGLAAAVLAAALFTVFLLTNLIVNPLREAAGR